jgi:para-aminobenzoate synthetase component 1
MATNAQPTVLTRGIDLALPPQEVFSNLHRMAGFFFLDSGLAGHALSRYSYVGVNPFLTVRSRGDGSDIVDGKKIEHRHGNPLEILAAILNELSTSGGSPLVPFVGGGVGYMSYELGRSTIPIELRSTDDLGLPEMVFSFYKTILAYEHKTNRWIGASVDLTGGRGTTVRKRLGNEIEKLKDLASRPHRGPVASAVADSGEGEEPVEDRLTGHRFHLDGVDIVSSLSRDAYLQAVGTIKEHIAAGDIYQGNLTQRWSVPFTGDPGQLYAALREHSPAPFGMYMNTGECIVIGSSPECFLSVEGRSVQTRPIKGTRRRGGTPEEDEALKRELMQSAKDRAELLMIADLERNDLGRVCEPGSVVVEDLYRLETFSNVHHLVSVVKGELKPSAGFKDLMDATFPSGSITGAPKKRAMEILDGLEGTVRGPYTGAMGYLSFDGSLALNVVIRTMILSQGICHLGVGSGIVSDSDPESEYSECVAKARGMLAALRDTASQTVASS